MGWGTGNIGGGSGGGLNFTVVGGTTAPSNPKENTIWVNTDTDITSWIFNATEPTVSAGMVWISTGTTSTVEFNALKKDGSQVYPISAKQYIDGTWVDKTAKSYQGGKWVDWITYLYKDGNEINEITGGWFLNGDCTKNATRNEDNIYVEFRGVAAKQTVGFFNTGKQIDLTNVRQITVNEDILEEMDNLNNGVDTRLIASPTLPSGFNDAHGSGANVRLYDSKTLDVSTLTGKHYIALSLGLQGQANLFVKLRLRKCFME